MVGQNCISYCHLNSNRDYFYIIQSSSAALGSQTPGSFATAAVNSTQTTPSALAAFKFTKAETPTNPIFYFGEASTTQGK